MTVTLQFAFSQGDKKEARYDPSIYYIGAPGPRRIKNDY